jgi:hypothetical protein
MRKEINKFKDVSDSEKIKGLFDMTIDGCEYYLIPKNDQ